MPAEALAQVLQPLTEIKELWPDVLVGLEDPDDAAVYRLDEERALVVTVDFFTPIVDDPFDYGAIAAANSLSDIYAMGARPILALNVAALPADLPVEVSAEIFRGGAEKARQAGIPVLGGHTVKDAEPKYGLTVVGMAAPGELKTKGGARPGDRLWLSKPLGSGVVTTGLKRDRASDDEIAAAVASMSALNREAARWAAESGAGAVTDVTGFGLLGHASEIARRSGVGLEIDFADLPWLPGARRLAEAGCFPGGALDNESYFGRLVAWDGDLDEPRRRLLFSPETSGGLLMSTRPEAVAGEAVAVGRVVAGSGLRVVA